MSAEQFRPRNAKTMSIVLYVVAVGGLIAALLSGLMPRDILLSIPVLALVAYSGYWLFWFPVLRIDFEGIIVVNPARTFTVPWAGLRSVETKYSLTLLTASGKISAWAAPAPSGMSRKSLETDAVLGVRSGWSAAKSRSKQASVPGHQEVQSQINWLQLGIPLGLVVVIVLCAVLVR